MIRTLAWDKSLGHSALILLYRLLPLITPRLIHLVRGIRGRGLYPRGLISRGLISQGAYNRNRINRRKGLKLLSKMALKKWSRNLRFGNRTSFSYVPLLQEIIFR